MNYTMSVYEMINLIVIISDQLDSLFNYWISASFAVLVSTYIGKEKFNFTITLCISILYFLASIMFLIRLYGMMNLTRYYVDLASLYLPETFSSATPLMAATRVPTFFLGLIITEVYLWLSFLSNRRERTANR